MNKDNSLASEQSDFLLYTTPEGDVKVEVFFQNETVWLTQKRMSELFGVDVRTISEHIQNIFKSNELNEISVIRKFRVTAADGKQYDTQFYNLDMIISVGYRVNSAHATRFRMWATKTLREFIIKGFALDDGRLKGNGGGQYWKELLDRIRDIRSSEKALYRQVLDLYATSIDYDPKSHESIQFFRVVQNKLHYATNQRTAAETIHERADAEKDFMGLTTFVGAMPILSDVGVAKNYLTQDELFRLNRLVSAFFDLAEIKAQEHTPMHMAEWVAELDKFAKNFGRGVLKDAGSVGHKQAIEKVQSEYRKYQAKTLSPVEEAYLESIKALERKVEKKVKKDDEV